MTPGETQGVLLVEYVRVELDARQQVALDFQQANGVADEQQEHHGQQGALRPGDVEGR